MESSEAPSDTQPTGLYHPRFPEHWDRCPLYSMASWVNGLAFRNINFSPDGLPVIKIAEIKGGSSGQTKYTQETFDDSVRVAAGDLLFSWSGQPETSIDAFWWHGPEGWLNQHVFRVTPRDGVDATFLYYLLRYLNRNFVAIAGNKQTTGLGHVTKRDLQRIEAACPELDEQNAIAGVLGALDDKIEQNRRTARALEGLARAIFRAWFVDFEPVAAKAAGAAFFPSMAQQVFDALPTRFVDSDVGPIPEGWAVKTATDIATVAIGKTPPRKEPQWFTNDPSQIPWVSIRDMGTCGAFIGKTSEYLTHEAVERFRVRRIPDRSVLFSFKLTLGRVTIADGEITSNEAIAHFIPNSPDSIGTEYLYCYLTAFDHNKLGSTSSIATATNSKIVKEMPVLVPTTATAAAFTDLTRPMFDALRSLTRESGKLAATRDYLLPRLLSGSVLVEATNG